MRKIPGPAGAELEHLIDIERNLPDGSLQDRAIAQALAEAEIKRTGTTARDPANVLNPEETVRTLGTGHLDETAGILALTSRRLVFLPQNRPETGLLIGSYLAAIQTVSLGKKITGKTLTIHLVRVSHIITHMGHGEGHRIARTFREMRAPGSN